jgi:starch phosphorylase
MTPEINKDEMKVAYFSMEIAIKNDIKSYSGGLGVLAGDTLKAAADLKVPMMGITLLNNKGYFKQIINENGEQEERIDDYDLSELNKLDINTTVNIKGDQVKINVWEYKIKGYQDHIVPVYFLDTDLEENKEEYRSLTGQLYGGDQKYRLMQEIVLGRGGVKVLPLLGYENIEKYHLNEGHAGLATVELLTKFKPKIFSLNSERGQKAVEELRKKCVFTTHTPVKAGHDAFSLALVEELQPNFPNLSELKTEEKLNMSHLAAYFSSYINGVSREHQKVSTKMFPEHTIASITNGVHSQTWTSPAFQDLFDEYIPSWRGCSLSLRNTFNIPVEKIWEAHQDSKRRLLKYIKKNNDKDLSEDVFTIGFARRFATYKRPTILFRKMEKLIEINEKVGKIQIIYAGKAHPHDQAGKDMIREINQIIKEYEEKIDIVFLEDYDMSVAQKMIPGVDLWLNTPLPPNEGSGTSGMKAAHNGVPHFSTLDGWWIEGYIKSKTGWAIGEENENLNPEERVKKDAEDIYEKLADIIIPRYYQTPEKWKKTMRHTIAVNASFFNSERMIRQYSQEAYL